MKDMSKVKALLEQAIAAIDAMSGMEDDEPSAAPEAAAEDDGDDAAKMLKMKMAKYRGE